MMRYLLAWMIMGMCVGSVFADVQKPELRSSYNEEALSAVLESIVVEEFVREERHYGSDKLYLIGLSPKGRLAYLLYETNPQYIQWNFLIVDLVTDEVLTKRSGEPHDEVVPPTEYFALKILLAELRIHQIHLSNGPIPVQPFPLEYKNDVYTTEVSAKEKAEDDWSPDARFGVILHSQNKGSKALTEVVCSSVPYVEGCLLSPFEDRIAVVVRYDLQYIEGESAGAFAITGGHLAFGFKR